MDIRELLELYLHHTLLGRASYLNQRRLIHQCFSAFNDVTLDAVAPLQVSQWQRRGYLTPHHANRALKTFRAAWSWGQRMLGITAPNPTLGIRPHRVFSRERSATKSEWESVQACLSGWSLALEVKVCTVYLTGCRPKEVRFMEKALLSLPDRRWRSLLTKNGRPMTYPLPEQLVVLLDRWLRCGQVPSESPWVFPGKNPMQPCCDSAFRESWRRFRRQMDLPDDLRTYDFRRTWATDQERAGTGLRVIQDGLGHANLQQTHIYIGANLDALRQANQTHADRCLPR